MKSRGIDAKFFFDIYIGALYLEKPAKMSDQVLSQNSPNRVFMQFIYIVAGEDFNYVLLNIWLGNEPADDA